MVWCGVCVCVLCCEVGLGVCGVVCAVWCVVCVCVLCCVVLCVVSVTL